MSQESLALEETLPAAAAVLERPLELHPRLQAQLEQISRTGPAQLSRLLPLVSAYYEAVDAERRGIVRSMQLLAEEARMLGGGLGTDAPGALRALLDQIQDVVITVATDGTIRSVNATAERLFGYSAAELIGRRLDYLLPDLACEAPLERALAALSPATPAAEAVPLARELPARRHDGERFTAELIVGRAQIEQRETYVLCLRDTSARARAEKLTAGERDVFERIAADAPLSQVLGAIAALVESIDATFLVGIGRLDAQGQIFAEVIGERVPARWRSVEQGLSIDMRNGSSAASVYLGRPVLVGDIAHDPFWQRRRELALELGLQAAWAVPIQASKGRMLGAVTIYRSQTGAPPPHDLQLLTHAAQLAGIAIERHQQQAALRASEGKFRSLYERVLDGVYQCDLDGRLREINPAFVKMLGYASAHLLYALPGIGALYRDPAQRAALERELNEQGMVHNAEIELRRADGALVVALESARLLTDADGRLIGYEGTLTDITARKGAEQAVYAEKERAQVTLQSIGDAVITTDAQGCIDYMNPVAERITGWPCQEARGQRLAAVMRLLDELSGAELEHPLTHCLREGQVAHSAEHSLLVNRQGQEIAINESAAPIRDRDGGIVGAVVVCRDVTKQRRLKRALAYQASHDALTGLINRRELDNRLAEALRSAHESGLSHVLLYMDLDQFKLVNDVCGHGAGDRLLRDITGLLQAHVRSGDILARLGGDEFGVLMHHCSVEEALRIAETIRQSIQEYRFHWDEHTSRVGVSIGVVPITPASQNVALVLSAADIACYAAKEAGRNRVHLYDARQDEGRERDAYWVARVTRALEHDRLELFCQPIVALGGERAAGPAGFELLLRLRDDDGELVPPRHFIPAAERYNVVSAIDRWVVRGALQVLAEIGAQHGQDSPGAQRPPRCLLALNLSSASLYDRAFFDFVLTSVQQSGLGAGLCFEFTEAAVLRNLSEAVQLMRELKPHGCRFALAQFGSDLSSFRYLKALPLDFLKLDGRLIARVAHDVVDRCMLEAIVRAAHALGIATVAEKVEDAGLFAELQRLGVDLAQGHYIAAPEPIALLAQGASRAFGAGGPPGVD